MYRTMAAAFVMAVVCAAMAQGQRARGVPPAQVWTEAPAAVQYERMPARVERGVSDWEVATALAADYLRQMHADVDHAADRPDNADNGWSWDSTESPDDPDDAGWDWALTSPPAPFHHSTAASAANLHGPCGLGVYDAYVAGGSSDAALLRVLQEVADYLLTTGTSYADEIEFLLKYQTLVAGTTYADAARAKWDAKITTYGTATAYAEYIRDARAGQGYENGIIPWDIANYVAAAQALHAAFPGNGYDGHADEMAEVVFQDTYADSPGYFDLEDDQQSYWYNLGVSGVIDCFKIADMHTDKLGALCALLLESQFPHGGFGYFYQDLWDWQTTAYAVLSLARFGDTYRQQIGLALDVLAATQDASGGFVYEGGSHYPEIAGEALSALTRGGASSSNLTMYAGANAFLVVHHGDSLWFEARGSRFSAADDWALAGDPCDGGQFSVNVPEYGAAWNSPWEAGSVHNFPDWEKYGLQLAFGPDVAGHEANVWRRPGSDPDAEIVGTAEWVLSYYETGRGPCQPGDHENRLDSTEDAWAGGTIVHSVLYGAVENLRWELTGDLGCAGSAIRFTGRLANTADEDENELYEFFGFGDHPEEASEDSDFIGKSDIVGYEFDFTVVWDHNDNGDYYYTFDGDVVLDVVTAGPNTLGLTVTSDLCVNTATNPLIAVQLEQALLAEPVRGYQAWTLYDDTLLDFVGGSYTSDPYPYPVIPVTGGGGAVDLAAILYGAEPTTADAVLATLTFDAAGTVTGDTFRFTFDTEREPPSRFTGAFGGEIVPNLQESLTVTVDNDPPVITCPADLVVAADPDQCSWTGCAGTATATDVGCGVASLVGTRSDGLSLDAPYPSGVAPDNQTTITWVATDLAGNTDTCVQTVTVTDAQAPVLTCPGDVAVECDASTNPPDTGAATATDNCDASPVVTYDDVVELSGCGGYTGTITRTWTATDASGNASQCVQTITVQDTTAPALTCPGDVAVECDASTDPAETGLATATDTCDASPVVTYDDVVELSGCGGYTGTITRTWTATDVCGNASQCVQVISIQDTMAPALTCPSPVAVECAADVPAAAADLTEFLALVGADVSDHCTAQLDLVVTPIGDVSDGLSCPETITRTYRATDACGNWIECAQTITVHDVTAPVVTCPGDIGPLPAAAPSCEREVTWTAAGAADNCDGDVSANVVYDIDYDAGSGWTDLVGQVEVTAAFPPGLHTVTARAGDACGNEGSCSFTVEISAFHELVLEVELLNLAGFSGTRCVTFELWNCTPLEGPVVYSEELAFVNGVTDVNVLLIDCAAYTCITARDELHTLRRTADSFAINGEGQYVASFTGDDALMGGNLNDDYWIDILDFGVYSWQYGGNYGTTDTTCTTPWPHADVDGTGTVQTGDFTFIQGYFLQHHEPDCCGQPGLASTVDGSDGPITEISVEALYDLGLGELAAGDLNADGWLDTQDIVAFFEGARPRPIRAEPQATESSRRSQGLDAE